MRADKNAHRAEEAAERFKEIQNAYEILSDKHERAWCGRRAGRAWAHPRRWRRAGRRRSARSAPGPLSWQQLQSSSGACCSGSGSDAAGACSWLHPGPGALQRRRHREARNALRPPAATPQPHPTTWQLVLCPGALPASPAPLCSAPADPCSAPSPAFRRYDDHRDQILRSGERHQAGGGSGGFEGGGGKPAEDEELFAYFSSSAYSGYGDGPKVRRAPAAKGGGRPLPRGGAARCQGGGRPLRLPARGHTLGWAVGRGEPFMRPQRMKGWAVGRGEPFMRPQRMRLSSSVCRTAGSRHSPGRHTRLLRPRTRAPLPSPPVLFFHFCKTAISISGE